MAKSDKIKVCVLYEDKIGGVGYYRSINPHLYLADKYSDEFDVDLMYKFPTKGDMKSFFSKYDIVQFHKMLDGDCKLIDIIHVSNPNAKIICDIDDYYKLPKEHPMYIGSTVVNKTYEKVIATLQKSDFVTTTTDIFADLLKKHNKNVFVIPNAINETEPQFKLEKTKSDRIRFGLVCGSSHLEDVRLLQDCIKTLSNDILDKIQFCLCGFNTEGNFTTYDDDGKAKVRPILPTESVYYKMERILTNDYKLVSPQHKEFLLKFIPNVEDPFKDEPYRRFWTLTIDKYFQHYRNIDVSLAPLVENTFDACKSQLKLIEAGYANIPCICQNFGSYTIDTISLIEKGGKINEQGNCLLVDSAKNHKQWLKHISLLVKNPQYIQLMADNLTKLMKERYSIETATKLRAEIYREIAKK